MNGYRPRLRARIAAIAVVCIASAAARPEPAPPPAQVSLTRLNCGDAAAPVDVAVFSDTYADEGMKLKLTFSCYLIRHGDDYMIWDTGNALNGEPEAPRTGLVDLLKQLRVRPEQVRYVGISHYHRDHTGQLAAFPQATLLIGKGDWDALTAPQAPDGLDAKGAEQWRSPFEHWIKGGGRVQPQAEDKHDVFGDGTVVMLSTPGHTPGHHSLLVRLKKTGNVLLTGDLTHFQENYDRNQVPTWNTSRAQTLASLDRFRQIAHNLNARVIIQHDPRDIGKLPAFPAAAD